MQVPHAAHEVGSGRVHVQEIPDVIQTGLDPLRCVAYMCGCVLMRGRGCLTPRCPMCLSIACRCAQWTIKGTLALRKKTDGPGLMVSGFQYEIRGFGFPMTAHQLNRVNEHCAKKYSGAKPALTASPGVRFLDYGKNKEGYWTYEHFKVQVLDLVDCCPGVHCSGLELWPRSPPRGCTERQRHERGLRWQAEHSPRFRAHRGLRRRRRPAQGGRHAVVLRPTCL